MKIISPIPGYLGSQAKDSAWLEDAFNKIGVKYFHDASAGGLAFPYYMARKGYEVTVSDISAITYHTAKVLITGPDSIDVDNVEPQSGYATSTGIFPEDIAKWIDGVILKYNGKKEEHTVKTTLVRTLIHFSFRGYSWDRKSLRSTTKDGFIKLFKEQYSKLVNTITPVGVNLNVLEPVDWKEAPFKYHSKGSVGENLFFINPDLPFTDGKPFGHFTLYEDIDSIIEQKKVKHPEPLTKNNVMDELNTIYDNVKKSGNYRYIAILFEDNAYPDSVTAVMWMQEKGNVMVVPSPGRYYSLGRQPHIVYLVIGSLL